MSTQGPNNSKEAQELRSKLILLVKAAYREAEKTYEAMQNLSYTVGEALQEHPDLLNEATLADIGYLFKKMEDIYLRTKRECFLKHDLIGRVLAVKITVRCTSTGGEPKAVGDLATAYPDIKVGAKLPKYGSEEWNMVMEGFGVNEVARKEGILTFHWPRLRDWLTKLEAKGMPVPLGLKSRVQQYPQCTYRRRKNATF